MGDEGQENVLEPGGAPNEQPNGPQNGPQNGSAPLSGALDEQELAAMRDMADQYRRTAEAKRADYDAMQKAVDEQLAEMNRIAREPTREERARRLTLAEEQKKLDQMRQTLFQLALAAEEAEHWAGEIAKGLEQARDAANGIEPQAEPNPTADQDLPDMDSLEKEDAKRKAGILSEHELDEMQRSIEEQQENANKLRNDIQIAQEEANQLDTQANQIVEVLGYYRDERMRKLDLGDVQKKLDETEQRIRVLMQQAAQTDQQIQTLKAAYEDSRKAAEDYKRINEEGFPEEEVDPIDPNEGDPYAKALAEKETQATEVYEMARSQMIQIQTVIDLLKKKSPEERAGDIPLDYLQDGLNRWSRDLPELKKAMETAKAAALAHQREVIDRNKKNYIRREMTDTGRVELDKIIELYCHQDDPVGPVPPPPTGLSVQADKLKAGNANRHSSREWNGMFQALSDLDLLDQLRDLQSKHAQGELDYGGEQFNELRSRINLAAEQTQRYVDYKRDTLLVKLGIGRGPGYLSEAQEALRYLRGIQGCIQTIDEKYNACTKEANERYEPQPAAPEEPKPRNTNDAPRPSVNRTVTHVKSKGNVGPRIP